MTLKDKMITRLILLLCTAGVSVLAGEGFCVMCYYTNWAQYRTTEGRFYPEDIPPRLCTHIIYAFGDVHPSSLTIVTTETNDIAMYSRVVALKRQNPDLKVLLAVGGAGHSIPGFRAASGTATNRTTFARNAITFLRSQHLDGLDMDWEYPGDYRSQFTLLLAALRAAFDSEAAPTNTNRLLLTAAVGASRATMEESYEVDKIHLYLDYVSLMTYDYNGHSWSRALGHNSPLYLPRSDNTFFSQNASVSDWMAAGLPGEKLVMGLATYGRSFRMVSRDLHHPGDSFVAGTGGDAGSVTASGGILAFYEICSILGGGAFTRVWNDTYSVPYAYGTRNGHWEWITYDDVTSVTAKADYIVSKGLGGAMFWNLDYDDFANRKCGLGAYPLIGTVSSRLASGVRVVSSTSATTTTITTTTTTTTPATTITTMSTTKTTGSLTTTTTATASSKVTEPPVSSTAATTARGTTPSSTAETMAPSTTASATTVNKPGASNTETNASSRVETTRASPSASRTQEPEGPDNASDIVSSSWPLLSVLSIVLAFRM